VFTCGLQDPDDSAKSEVRVKLREIPFGTPIDDPDGYCVYTNGHVDKTAFLEAVKVMAGSDIPDDARGALELEDVEHIRFRPMSPSEARGNGLTWGVMQTEDRGYPVTAVKL
jgi:hypothetical protein